MKVNSPLLLLHCAAFLALAGCSPALNWRKLTEAQFSLDMPCKPVKASRKLTLAGEERDFQLAACDAKGIKFSYSFAELSSEANAVRASAEMEQSLTQHLKPKETPSATGVRLKSAQQARRIKLEGKAPNAKPVWVETLFFTRGKTAAQLTVLSELGPIREEVADDFFRSVTLQ